MSNIEKLNLVLTYLNHDRKERDTYVMIEEGLRVDFKHKELVLILEKLVKDRFVVFIYYVNKAGKPIETLSNKIYYITFDGKVFIENGGYVNQINIEKQKALTQKLINFALIFGGVAAGGYYILEILRWICNRL